MYPQMADDKFVLIAEDEHDNREIMRSVVEDLLGHKALLAKDGEEALRIAADKLPRLILMDLMMPTLDGFEAIRRLKDDANSASIPIIAVTALSRPGDKQRAIASGADSYLSKPFDLDLMASIIEQYLGCGHTSHDNYLSTGIRVDC